tara:strand:- start:35098 stop:35268 length:171 start_codon:yes stop_codon:yes gene_type:complete
MATDSDEYEFFIIVGLDFKVKGDNLQPQSFIVSLGKSVRSKSVGSRFIARPYYYSK